MRGVVFLFSGQGSQYVQMGRELYDHEPLFRQTVDECAELLAPKLGLDVRRLLYPDGVNQPQVAPQLNQTKYTQPALFVIEYALARLWQSWGLEPQAMLGHSIGEYVAACFAGVFSLPDALHLVAVRGQLMQDQPPGHMLVIALTPETVRPYLSDTLSLAAINGPKQVVVAGPAAAIADLEHLLTEQGVKVRSLATSHAFHSSMMEPMLEPFSVVLAQIRLNPPHMPFLSSVTGTWITDTQATDPAYWVNQVRQPVNFAAGLATLLEQPNWLLLEVGPGTALLHLAKHHPQRSEEQPILASLPHPDDKRTALHFLLQTLGQIALQGLNVNWDRFYTNEVRRRVLLPTYPFQRQRYWIDLPISSTRSEQGAALSEKLPLARWFAIPTWKQSQPATFLPQLDYPQAEQCCLLFLDELGLGQHLAARLQQSGQTVITVVPGATFHQSEAQQYTLNPRHREHYQALFREMEQQGKPPTTIVHLWQVTDIPLEISLVERLTALEHVYQHGFDSLLFLAQVLGERGDDTEQNIIAISNQMHAVLGDEPMMPEKATLLGCCRVIGQEYPQLACRNVDVILPQNAPITPVVDQILSELDCHSDDILVAYRGRHRWVQTFETVVLPDPSCSDTAAQSQAPLRQQGVYLLTAGLSQTGLHIASFLAAHRQAKVILVDHPDVVKTHTESINAAGAVEALKKLGAEVLVLPADVTDLAQMQNAVAQAIAHFGCLHGVIHISTATNDGLIQLKAISTTRSVLAPSVRGCLVLEAALQEIALDFLVLFGSTVAISGGLGQVDECAAATFLDAYAQSRTSTNHHQGYVTTIDWSLWQWDDRFEQSMAEFLNVQTQFREMRETFGITQDEAGDALMRILRSRQPHIVVSPQGIENVIAQQRALTMENVVAQLETQTTTSFVRDNPNQITETPVDALEAKIAAVWQAVFGLAQVGRHDNFFDLGGHSLLSIQLINRLRKTLERPELALSVLFEAPTVAKLANLVRASQADVPLSLEELAFRDDADMAALMAEIEGMSDDEIAAALAAED